MEAKWPSPVDHNTDRHSLGKAVVGYLHDFEYHASIRSGYSYDSKFKEVYAWCESNLGRKFKDWHMIGGGTYQSTSTIHIRDGRRATLFALMWSDIVIHTFDMH